MGWETRQRGGLYYVKKRREGNRVVSHYLGKSEIVCAIAYLDHAEQQEKEAEARAERQSREEQALRERNIQAFCHGVQAVFRLQMEAGGWYPHRGQWRRGRGAAMAISTENKARMDL